MINWNEDERMSDDVCKRVRNGAVALTYPPTHSSTQNHTFAQKFAQLASMRNTMRNRNGNAYHTNTQNPIPENLCKRLRKRSRDINTNFKSANKTTFAFFDIIDE